MYKLNLTFLYLLAYTGDRAGDLGNLSIKVSCHLPDNSGLCFSITSVKTADLTNPREVFLFYSQKQNFVLHGYWWILLHFAKEII